MPSRRLTRLAAIAVLSTTALLTVSCASTPEPAPTASETAPDPVIDPAPTDAPDPEQPAEEPEQDAESDPVEVTCDALISSDLVADLEAQDWTFKEEPFGIGEATFADGLSCTWADFRAATGNLLIFAWAPLTAAEVADAETQLEADGWIREDGTDGVYFTEDPSQALATDENGYGMTYLFGEDWVTLSDTKQGLLLIERPAV